MQSQLAAEKEVVNVRTRLIRLIAIYLLAVPALGGWTSAQAASAARPAAVAQPAATGSIAYVIRRDTPDILNYRDFLVAQGYTVTIVPLGAVLGTDFSVFDLTVIADDTGSLTTWGIPPNTAAQVAKILAGNKPILGIGEGGYAFFGQVPDFIGWPQGWHGPQALVNHAPGAPPATFASLPPDPIKVYTHPSNEVGIYLAAVLPGVNPIGLEVPSEDHASLIVQGCHFLWGFSDEPAKMTGDGQTLLANYVEYARVFQCSRQPPPPPQECYELIKSATPASGTTIPPGSVTEYSISYAINPTGGTNCLQEGRLVDVVPADTVYVPGSASDGISPSADGSLTWVVTGFGVKTFKVIVLDTPCRPTAAGAPGTPITNQAMLYPPPYLPVASNVVTHSVQCGPVGFPNDKPPYAEDEIQINPYPIIAGKPTEISV